MQPRSHSLAEGVTVTSTTTRPYPSPTIVRWNRPDTFTHSLTPVPYGTLLSAQAGQDYTNPSRAAEYLGGGPGFKNADVEFVITAKRFAIPQLTYKGSDAMIWIDDHPVADQPFRATGPTGTVVTSWLDVTFPTTRTVTVRFAGPAWFAGIEYPSNDAVIVSAPPRRFTVGILSDSHYDAAAIDQPGVYGSGALELATQTGYRVWNLSQPGTGYINDGTGAQLSGDRGYAGLRLSPFGSQARIAAVRDAPIDALLINGSLNDEGWTPEEHRAVLRSTLNSLVEARPDLPIVVIGLEAQSFGPYHPDGPGERDLAFTANFREVIQDFPNVVGFIDPNTENWLTGMGSVANPTGEGNQDQYVGPDGIHLNPAGQTFFQAKVIEQLRNISLQVPWQKAPSYWPTPILSRSWVPPRFMPRRAKPAKCSRPSARTPTRSIDNANVDTRSAVPARPRPQWPPCIGCRRCPRPGGRTAARSERRRSVGR